MPAATSEPYAWHTESGAAAQLAPEGVPPCPWQWWLPAIAKLGQLYRQELRVLNSALFIAPTVPLPEQEVRPASTYCHSPRPSLGFPLVLAAPAAADAPVPSAPAPALAPALHRCSTQVLLPTHSPVITSVTVTLPLSARTTAAASGQLRLVLDRDYVATLAKSMGLINQFIPGSV